MKLIVKKREFLGCVAAVVDVVHAGGGGGGLWQTRESSHGRGGAASSPLA